LKFTTYLKKEPLNTVEITSLYKKYSIKEAFAVKNLSLNVGKGELLALVGESGSGKTTLLRLIAGFEEPDKGEIRIAGNVVVNDDLFIAPEKRRVGMVFQDYALFPHLTVYDNIAFGLQKLKKEEKELRIREVLKLVGLQSFEKRYPHELSGGQQQRTALARALAPNPDLILLDEPFSNLDGVMKDRVREEIKQIIKSTGITAIFVTHDTKDALSTADKIAILKDGKIQQLDVPKALYNDPKNIYVANFFGKVNVINAVVESGGYDSQIGFIPSGLTSGYVDKVMLSIRPENISIVEPGESSLNGIVDHINYFGDYYEVSIMIKRNNHPFKILIKCLDEPYFKVGESICFKIRPDKINVLDTCWYPAAIKN
jgi:iron(III) transport system ATP-binding protein